MFKKLTNRTIEYFKKINKIEFLITVLLLCFYLLFLDHKIDITTVDLGRHLKNGQLLISNFFGNYGVLNTNFYSYAEPFYATINHHWLSGVVFFMIYNFVGFVGLHLFFIFLSIVSFWLFYRLAKKEAGIKTASIISLLLIPLIAERTDIRPEVFSYLFCGIFLTILYLWKNRTLSYKWLFVLPFLQIIWANLHIYFVIGPALILVFFLPDLAKYASNRRRAIESFVAFMFTAFATIINPFGISGALEPFKIFNNYGYMVAENQSVWFLEKLGFFYNPNFIILKISAVLLFLTLIFALFFNIKRISILNIFLPIVFCLAGFLAMRNFTIFGLFAIYLISENIKSIRMKIKSNFIKENYKFVIAFLGVIIFIFVMINNQSKIYGLNMGLGLQDNNNASAEFFINNKLSGPIFNNYDVGGYLIFNLFPKEKVFVDNRPEAYPTDFFENHYVPMQQDERIWKQEDDKYNFNCIFFSYRDMTPWAQDFLASILKDKNWEPVFVDRFNIIFLKNNDKNFELIKHFAIPKSSFKIAS